MTVYIRHNSPVNLMGKYTGANYYFAPSVNNLILAADGEESSALKMAKTIVDDFNPASPTFKMKVIVK